MRSNLKETSGEDTNLKKQIKNIEPTTKLGCKSIFFDPELNPEGIAPKSFKKNYIYYPSKKRNFTQNNDYNSAIVAEIPLPNEPMPKYFKFHKNESIITSDEVITKNPSTMIPISVHKNRKRKNLTNEVSSTAKKREV